MLSENIKYSEHHTSNKDQYIYIDTDISSLKMNISFDITNSETGYSVEIYKNGFELLTEGRSCNKTITIDCKFGDYIKIECSTSTTINIDFINCEIKLPTIKSAGNNNVYNENIVYNTEIPNIIPIKEGYTFLGWKDEFDNVIESVWNYTTDTQFYAVWETITYNIEYELNGGEIKESNLTTYNIETNDILLRNPIKTNMIFMGWFLESDFSGQRLIVIKKGTSENLKLYAKFLDVESADGFKDCDDFIIISKKETLLNIKKYDKEDNNKYRLYSDFDLESQCWIGLGSETYPFTGIFDGNGHTISNFSISKSETTEDMDGFFVSTDGAIIKNLGLKNIVIYRDYSNQYDEKKVGGLVGLAKNTSIYNCFVDGYLYIKTNSNAFSSTIYLGGLVGDGTMSTYIYNCYTTGSIKLENNSTHSQSKGYVAGLVAYCGYIYNSYSTADITCKALTSYAFGIGYFTYCENSFATGDISSISTSGDAYVGNNNYSPNKNYNVNLFSAMSQNIEISSDTGTTHTYHKGIEKVLISFYNEQFIIETIKFGKYISSDDLIKNPNNVWAFEENNYPKLYWEK